MRKPLISIIVPVYNVERYLNKCLDSIIHQTYNNLEIVLVDDGSTDWSGLICDAYATKDNRVTVIHKENNGLSAARNIGLEYSHGELIGFVDSDDYVDRQMYEILLRQLEEDKSDIAICDYMRVDESYSAPENKVKTLVSSKCFSRGEFIDELLKYYGGHFVVA